MFKPQHSKAPEFTVPTIEVHGLRLVLSTVPNKKMCISYKLDIFPQSSSTLTEPDASLLSQPAENSLHGDVVVTDFAFAPRKISICFDLFREELPEGFEFEEVGFLCQVAQSLELKAEPEIVTRPRDE